MFDRLFAARRASRALATLALCLAAGSADAAVLGHMPAPGVNLAQLKTNGIAASAGAIDADYDDGDWGGTTIVWWNGKPHSVGCARCGLEIPIIDDVDPYILRSVDQTGQSSIEEINMITGSVRQLAQIEDDVKGLAFDSVRENVLVQTDSALALVSPSGALLARTRLSNPISALTFNAASRTFAAVSLPYRTLLIYSEALTPLAAVPLPSLPLSGTVRIVADDDGNLFVHGAGNSSVYAEPIPHPWGSRPFPTPWRQIKLATHSAPFGIASDGTALYFAVDGKLEAFNLAGSPIATSLTGLPAPRADIAIGFAPSAEGR